MADIRDFFKKADKFISKMGKVKTNDLIIFLKQFAALIESGVPIVSALTVLTQQSKNKKLKYTLEEIKADVESGKSLSEAMEKHPKVFPKTVRSTVRIGETSGLLDTSLNQVIEYIDEQATIKGEVMTALIYPSIVLTATIGVLVFMVLVVIPQMLPFIQMMGGKMPWNTKLLISVTNFAQKNVKTIAIVLGALIALIFLASRTRRGKYILDYILMYLPFFGIIIKYSTIVQFAKTMYLLLNSGVTIEESLKIVRDSSKNSLLRSATGRFIGKVLLGEPLSESVFREKALFPPMVGSMIKVGEETGTIDLAMRRAADIHYSILHSYIKKLNAALEPVMLLVLGGLVGFVASGMIGGILAGYVLPK